MSDSFLSAVADRTSTQKHLVLDTDISRVMTLPPTEEANEISDSLDALDALGFVRVLRGVDAQVFSGWRHHEGLLDTRPLAAAERTAQAAKEVLLAGGVVAITGCGTSGRVAHLVARRFNRLLAGESDAASFDYLISGGDAALLLSDELPEDDPTEGATQLADLAAGRAACLHIGVSCGLSAAYVCPCPTPMTSTHLDARQP